MMDIKSEYEFRYTNVLVPVAQSLEEHLRDTVGVLPRIDRIVARAKSVDRFMKKALKIEEEVLKYSDPLNQIQDQIGARIITFYLHDVDLIANEIVKYFRPIESKFIVPDSESEFGYFGKHFILFLPNDIVPEGVACPIFFELQIKTLFQHAWGEANHDLGYKPEGELSSEDKRKIAFTSAQAWGADMIFSELHRRYDMT